MHTTSGDSSSDIGLETSDPMDSINSTAELVAKAADSNNRLKSLQDLINLVEQAIGLPLLPNVNQARDKAKQEGTILRLQEAAEGLDSTHSDVKHLRDLNSRLFKRWDLESKFRVAYFACKRFLSRRADYESLCDELIKVDDFLEVLKPEEMKDFIPAREIITWLDSAATDLDSVFGFGISTDSVSQLMVNLKLRLRFYCEQ